MSARGVAAGPTGAARPTFGAARLAEDTRERFLREIAARVPADRIDECFLFPPMRQGGAETGVAVLAVRHAADEAPASDAAVLVDVTPDGDPTEAAADDAGDAGDASRTDGDAGGDGAPAGGPPEPAPPAAPAERPGRERHTVFMARYRLTVKGPERGRWEIEVREEADAPLVTVEEVVRGVGRRAGDAAEPQRLDRAAVARLAGGASPVPAPAPAPAG